MNEAFGSFPVKLDEKSRLILPAKARAQWAEGTFLVKGQDQCLHLFSKDQFDRRRELIREETPEGIPALAFDRVFFSSLVSQTPDKQGRITIPSALRQYASLDRDVVMVGLEGRMEIWDVIVWQEYLDTYAKQFASLKGLR